MIDKLREMRRGAAKDLTPAPVVPTHAQAAAARSGSSRLLGSLKDALLAASRESTDRPEPLTAPLTADERARARSDAPIAVELAHVPPTQAVQSERQVPMTAEIKDAVPDRPITRHAAVPSVLAASPAHPPAQAPAHAQIPLTGRVPVDAATLSDPVPRTRPAPRGQGARASSAGDGDGRTQLIRGKQKVSRARFHQDPVVGWLVVVGGPGLGAHRSIYEGNNTVGRASSQRIPIDFGDDTISGEEQAYIRYDSSDRSFLFVPNLAKTNVVQVNDRKPTGAVALQAMDVITMGRTQLVFVPFCGSEFDWAELSDVRE